VLVVGLAREHAPGRDADVGAVEAEPDGAAQLDGIGLGERRVGADRARRVAVGAGVDAGGDEFAIEPRRQRVGLEDLQHHRAIRRNLSEGARPSQCLVRSVRSACTAAWLWVRALVAVPVTSLQAATDEVTRRDPALRRAAARLGPIEHRPRDPDGPFGALVRSIVYQQLAGRAAQAIYGRVRTAVGADLTPEAIQSTPDAMLRAAGLSANKLASLRDLSEKVLDGSVVLTRTSRKSDDELIERLTAVRGIGPWTAEMYLMFQLRRLDVWPVDDLGVRQGYALIWGLDAPPKPKELELLGERFRPYRSVVARYCWAAVAEQRTQVLPTAPA
jgi:DNA-3-methyladenine glycosylase II